MKKNLLSIALVTILFTILLATPIYAAGNYEANLKLVQNERTDEYALDYHKNKLLFNDSDYVEVIKQAKIITAGITDDYAKVKAIHDWVSNNIWYDCDAAFGDGVLIALSPKDVLKYKRTVCEGYANLTVALLQASGFPAKLISGTLVHSLTNAGHAWTEVWVNGRWVFLDTTLDTFNAYVDGQFCEKLPCKSQYFDISLADYSRSHTIDAFDFKELDRNVWTGSLYFYDIVNSKILKEIKNFPLNGLVTETYGFDINDLYNDNQCTDRFKLNTMRVDSTNNSIIVKASPKSYKVTFDSNNGTTVKPVTVTANSTIAKPTNPTRAGYQFANWYKDIKCTKPWNFTTDKVTANTTLYAGWYKTYIVTFNSNNGTAVKPITVIANTTFTKPTTPTRAGYKFANWYKDAKCTKVWNFATDKVTANTTLYAGWYRTYTVTFNSNKGTTVKPVTVVSNSTFSKPTNPTRAGYKFVNWYKDAKCTKVWNFATDKVTANTTLYAGWTKA